MAHVPTIAEVMDGLQDASVKAGEGDYDHTQAQIWIMEALLLLLRAQSRQ